MGGGRIEASLQEASASDRVEMECFAVSKITPVNGFLFQACEVVLSAHDEPQGVCVVELLIF